MYTRNAGHIYGRLVHNKDAHIQLMRSIRDGSSPAPAARGDRFDLLRVETGNSVASPQIWVVCLHKKFLFTSEIFVYR